MSGEGEWAGGIVGLERNYNVVEELTAECEYLVEVLKTMDASAYKDAVMAKTEVSSDHSQQACRGAADDPSVPRASMHHLALLAPAAAAHWLRLSSDLYRTARAPRACGSPGD